MTSPHHVSDDSCRGEDGQAVIDILKAHAESLPSICIDTEALQASKSHQFMPKNAEKLSQVAANVELQKNLYSITKTIMSRSYCSVCKEHVEEDVKLYRTCANKATQHLECTECFSKNESTLCSVCRTERPQPKIEQSEDLRYDFYHTKCQDCPLCTDDTMHTPQGLLEHVETECPAVNSSDITMNRRKLTSLLIKHRERSFAAFWALPETQQAISEPIDRLKKKHADTRKRQRDEMDHAETVHQESLRKLWQKNIHLETINDGNAYVIQELRQHTAQRDEAVKKVAELRDECKSLEQQTAKLREQAEEHKKERSKMDLIRAENERLGNHLENHRQHILRMESRQRFSQRKPERPQRPSVVAPRSSEGFHRVHGRSPY
ncbi:hypothetical protein CYMTET_5178 [Cymbomonas tetramitiformis]|uniref:Uncharacterized protein n=1 Tax=Cymbomonas tetramitiformis TaxID=36881 RepID=A0AAE0GZX1_9CHLO|nr:hypothetical protein CYMTET_5178 [Cymbomonas tetramitiformis]|eukprot:gene21211-25483_t